MGSRLFQSVVMPLMRVRAAARGIERLHEDWLVLMCCDMVHAHLVWSGCLWNRATA